MTPKSALRPAFAALFLMTTPAFAQTVVDDASLIAGIGALLGRLLLVLVLLESAMAALFNWRVYRAVLSGRAWKTPLMFGLGLMVVNGFGYDFMATALQDIAGAKAAGQEWLSVTLSAMVIAGGSQGVHDILKRLGLRSPIPEGDSTPPLKEDAVGDIQIILSETGKPAENALVGSVAETGLWKRLTEVLGFAHLRFPRTGGRVVKVGVTYDLKLQYVDKEGKSDLHPMGSYAFAPRAIVDLDLTA